MNKLFIVSAILSLSACEPPMPTTKMVDSTVMKTHYTVHGVEHEITILKFEDGPSITCYIALGQSYSISCIP